MLDCFKRFIVFLSLVGPKILHDFTYYHKSCRVDFVSTFHILSSIYFLQWVKSHKLHIQCLCCVGILSCMRSHIDFYTVSRFIFSLYMAHTIQAIGGFPVRASPHFLSIYTLFVMKYGLSENFFIITNRFSISSSKPSSYCCSPVTSSSPTALPFSYILQDSMDVSLLM